MFSFEFCEISKNTFFPEHLRQKVTYEDITYEVGGDTIYVNTDGD